MSAEGDLTKLPLRVLVKGATTVIYTSWMSGPRSDFAWPRVLESEIHAAGWPVDFHTAAVPAELTKEAYPHWPVEVLAWSPDVVVMDYGRMETVHLFIPKWLERYVNKLDARPQPLRQAYRKRVLRPAFKALAHVQQALDARLPTSSTLWRVRRGQRDIEGLIRYMRTVASPLVLLLEAPPFGKVYQGWFPGANPRVEVMNQAVQDIVRGFDTPDVRYVPLAHLWEPLLAEGQDPCPDGGHYTPEMHRAVGEAVADVVLEWAEKQPHLLVEPRPRS
jgi:hypothetical protein